MRWAQNEDFYNKIVGICIAMTWAEQRHGFPELKVDETQEIKLESLFHSTPSADAGSKSKIDQQADTSIFLAACERRGNQASKDQKPIPYGLHARKASHEKESHFYLWPFACTGQHQGSLSISPLHGRGSETCTSLAHFIDMILAAERAML